MPRACEFCGALLQETTVTYITVDGGLVCSVQCQEQWNGRLSAILREAEAGLKRYTRRKRLLARWRWPLKKLRAFAERLFLQAPASLRESRASLAQDEALSPYVCAECQGRISCGELCEQDGAYVHGGSCQTRWAAKAIVERNRTAIFTNPSKCI